MTTVYFIRHAESDHADKNERTRRLSAKGKADVPLVTRFFDGKIIDAAFSSPYQRAIDTIRDVAEKHSLIVQNVEGFREWERKSDPSANFSKFCRKHWSDPDYRYSEGESLNDVRRRNVTALNDVLSLCEDKTVIIGTHGMALSAVISFFDSTFGCNEFFELLPYMPLIVKITFDKHCCMSIERFKLL